MRKHGIDFGVWRQWATPDNPPKPLDFVVAGITYGASPNRMYAANKLALQDFSDNGGNLLAYHFYTPVNALSQVRTIVPHVREVGAFGVAIDWESSAAHTIGKEDVPVLKDIVYSLWNEFPKDKVLVYASHNKWKFLRDIDPHFADEVELWLTWPIKDPDIDHFHPYYAKYMGRQFDQVRLFQYSWWGDAHAYGVLNDPIYIDLDVYTHKQPFEEWVGASQNTNTGTVSDKLAVMDGKLDKILDWINQQA